MGAREFEGEMGESGIVHEWVVDDVVIGEDAQSLNLLPFGNSGSENVTGPKNQVIHIMYVPYLTARAPGPT